MKLWDKGYAIDNAIERFTVGKDKELDLLLATHDILGTIAHVTMLAEVGLLSKDDLRVLPHHAMAPYWCAMPSKAR